MASVSFPLQPQTTSVFSQRLDSIGQPSGSRSRHNFAMPAPLPNPPFVFPAREPDAMSQAIDDTPNLPAFSFNPGSIQPSQPTTPTSTPTLPTSRPVGHRRRCSEFVGGEHMVASGISDAGQKSGEDSTPGPARLPAPGPGFSAMGPGRRRHAHRRSAAVSSVDLTAISKAFGPESLVESAPRTPADGLQDLSPSDLSRRPISNSATNLGRPTPPASPQITINGVPPSNAQPEVSIVSDAAERPLSDVSRNSESTIQSMEVARDNYRPGPSTRELAFPMNQSPKPRPRTADASLMLNPNNTGSDELSGMKHPLSAAGHSRFRKSMSSGILDAKLRKSDRMREDTRWAETLRHSSSDDGDSVASGDDHAATESPSTSKKRSKTKKRQKKVRSWAGAILTRGKVKRKDDMAGSKSSPSPVLTRTNSDLGSGLDVNFDDDNVVVIRTPTNPTSPDSHSPSDNADAPASLENSWKPRSFYEQGRQNDVLSPIIDLDAALGPFNTPDMGSSGTAKSGFSAATKRMYSGGRRGEFVGPEMRYHRRTESAPEMPPFDRSFLNNRLVNNSALENPDVFYEEEEDAFLAATSENDERGPLQGVAGAADQQSLESKESSDTLTRQPGENFANPQEQTGLGIQKQEPDDAPDSLATCSNQENQNPTDQQSASDQLRDARNPFSNQPKSPVELIKHEDWLRKVPVPPSPDISPRFLPTDRPATSPIDFTPNIPIPPLSLQGGTSVSNSPFPSPDFAGSSPDFPRSITTSSTTDRNFSSPSYNPSMEFPHASADDVPSLTSSASTTTNTLNRFSATFFQRSRLSTDRSASFSAAGNRRNSQANSSKRSSLASLSKLVGGPHVERSKLSYEEKPPSDEPEKTKKGRRISRLMHFWRTKEKDRLNQNTVQEERPS